MYKKILIALALDQGHAPKAVEVSNRLKTEDGDVIAIHVIDQVPGYSSYFIADRDDKKIKQDAKDLIIERMGDDQNIEAVVLTGHPGRTVTDYAEKIGADCIIVGCHKPGIKDFFLGSTAARIMRYAKCSVHLLR